MQNIKFRAFSLKTNDWVYGYYAKFRNFKNEVYECIIPVDKETGEAYMKDITAFAEGSLGQFIGLYDKYGKEIYEGDIIQDFLGYRTIIVHKTKYSAFVAKDWDTGYALWFGNDIEVYEDAFQNGEAFQIEVIGNIFQNKDLLHKRY